MKARITITGEPRSKRMLTSALRVAKLEITDENDVLTFKSMQNARQAMRTAYKHILQDEYLSDITDLTDMALTYDAGTAILERVNPKP